MPSGTKRRVLVVDDSATARAHCVAVLSASYECLVAADGEEGLAVATRERPDVILLDLEMPKMDGAAMLRRLRDVEATRAIPVVVMTASVGVQPLALCRGLGCSGYVLKPVRADYLIAKIARLTSL